VTEQKTIGSDGLKAVAEKYVGGVPGFFPDFLMIKQIT